MRNCYVNIRNAWFLAKDKHPTFAVITSRICVELLDPEDVHLLEIPQIMAVGLVTENGRAAEIVSENVHPNAHSALNQSDTVESDVTERDVTPPLTSYPKTDQLIEVTRAPPLTSDPKTDQPSEVTRAPPLTSYPKTDQLIEFTRAPPLTSDPKTDQPIEVTRAPPLTSDPKTDQPIEVTRTPPLTSDPKTDLPIEVTRAPPLTPDPKTDQPIEVTRAPPTDQPIEVTHATNIMTTQPHVYLEANTMSQFDLVGPGITCARLVEHKLSVPISTGNIIISRVDLGHEFDMAVCGSALNSFANVAVTNITNVELIDARKSGVDYPPIASEITAVNARKIVNVDPVEPIIDSSTTNCSIKGVSSVVLETQVPIVARKDKRDDILIEVPRETLSPVISRTSYLLRTNFLIDFPIAQHYFSPVFGHWLYSTWKFMAVRVVYTIMACIVLFLFIIGQPMSLSTVPAIIILQVAALNLSMFYINFW